MTTNYEKRKNMTFDEMVEDLHNIDCAMWEGAKRALLKMDIELTGYDPVRSKEAIREWLQSESEV